MKRDADGRCWAEIDLGALRRNAAMTRECAGGSAQLMAVVKANGYGHGMTRVAIALTDVADLFGVANLDEATELREAVSQPILILGPALPEERSSIAQRGFIPSISNFEEAAQFDLCAARPVAINFVIDTGMGRVGASETEALGALKKIATLPKIKLHSVSTHLPSADDDPEFTRAQLARFGSLVRQIRQAFSGDYKVHALASAALIRFGEEAFDIVRAGLMLYGVSPVSQFQDRIEPVMTLKSRVVLVRDLPPASSISYGRTFITPGPMRVATLGVGYADGCRRSLSNSGASVLIGGRRCAILGRITMDLLMADVTGLTNVQAGDEAVLIGRQGDEQILASEVAERAGTIAWEVFTGIGSRVRRVYL